MSQNFDITIPAGESFFFETTIRQSSEPNAQPINLAGFTAVGQLREDWDKPLLASFEIIFLLPRTTGKIRFVLSDEVTRALPVSRARYDIFITDQEGTTRKLLEGYAFIERNISR